MTTRAMFSGRATAPISSVAALIITWVCLFLMGGVLGWIVATAVRHG